jgi:phosphoribosylformylglycinamidine synthase subunit PurL
MESYFKPALGNEPEVNYDLAKQHGLLKEEYERIIKILGRVPTYTELGVFSVMWSEHCSYKNSIALLKTLPKKGKHLLVEAGEENAGLVDIGDELAVSFKIESHNHPSAVEPYQGAATGVGGILRDIISMGARPIAVLDSLRFGNLSDPHTKQLLTRVVKGIADYGNSFGVPTVAGEVYFDDSYGENPLVNAMAVGIVEHGKVAKALASGEGNSVLIVGSKTGRDGIHGATFASEEISDASEAKRPSVQVGDPFAGKLLLEATLEAIATGYLIGVQDMGAAGIICSTSEMSARGNSGMVIDTENISIRENGMSPYEILLSESQERMLYIVKKGHEEAIIAIAKKWDLDVRVAGIVQSKNLLEFKIRGKNVVTVPPDVLVLGGGAPIYHRETREPSYLVEANGFDIAALDIPIDINKTFIELLVSPNIASKHWVYEQYDSMVRTNTVDTTFSDAAVVRIKGIKKGLVVKTDCNARFVYLNPRRGTQIAVAESARNVVCVGAKPIAITNCLNFGNPYDPEIYWQFSEAILGMKDACLAFETPVTGGNVSFYNEGPSGAIIPTPVIGMLGIIDDADAAMTANFKQSGDLVLELGVNKCELGGSEYLSLRTGKILGNTPEIDLQYEKGLHDLCLELIRQKLIHSAHDVSDGGLAVTITEGLFGNTTLGFDLDTNYFIGKRIDAALFGESQSRIVVSTESKVLNAIKNIANKVKVDCAIIGKVTDSGKINFGPHISADVRELNDLYSNAIETQV